MHSNRSDFCRENEMLVVEHSYIVSNAIGCSYYLWAILGSSLSVCISLMGASATHVPRVSAPFILCTLVLVSPTGLPFGAVGLNGYIRWGEFQHTLTVARDGS